MNEKRDDFIKAYVHVFGCKNGLFVIRKFFFAELAGMPVL